MVEHLGQPKISVCIPCYNARDTIKKSLHSVLEQSAHDRNKIDILVVDDNSVDGTQTILDEFRQKYGIRVLYNKTRLGLVGNWQKTLSLANGEIITLLHQDDWYDRDCLTTVIELFEEQSNIVLVALGQIYHQEQNDALKFSPRKEIGRFRGTEYRNRRLYFQDCPAPSTTFMRKEALVSLKNYYDNAFRFCPELDLYIRLTLSYPTAWFIHDPRPLVYRGGGVERFSLRYPGYRILDTCNILSRYTYNLEDKVIRDESIRRGGSLIAQDLISLLRLDNNSSQIMKIINSRNTLYWLFRNQRNILMSLLKVGYVQGNRKIRALLQKKERIIPDDL